MNYESSVTFTIKTMDLTANRRFVEVVSFDSSIEHPKIGEKIHLKDEFRKITLPNGVEVKFEEIIGLAGDLTCMDCLKTQLLIPLKENRKTSYENSAFEVPTTHWQGHQRMNYRRNLTSCWLSLRKKESWMQKQRTKSLVVSGSSAFQLYREGS